MWLANSACPNDGRAGFLASIDSTQRKVPKTSDDEAALTADIIALATHYGRCGYRRITAMLRRSGWAVNRKRVERIWRREGLKVPQKQPKRGRLWCNETSCIRLRPQHPNHVLSYDFVQDRTHNGRSFRMLNIIDEFTRECLTIRIGRKLKAVDVIDTLSDLVILRGVPGHIRSTTARSSLPRRCANGLQLSAPGPPISCQVALGRTATARASTRSSATSCSMAKSSTHWKRPRSSSKAGGAITIQCATLSPWLSSTRPGGGPVAGYAPQTRFAGHAGRSANTRHALTFQPDHPLGFGHQRYPFPGIFDRPVPPSAAATSPRFRPHPPKVSDCLLVNRVLPY
ncbi:hypothetical protein BQ8482_60150 [Mesorhizobium delmotii]|uniref:HTH-like domain-containing protein n=1 Tax=Mesorhizobium delmotii TaxID=1631247 RepID=A0A2P9AVJ5_9HYPH|nr:hypothetical protein BQ8482_60150 [Mesorhizobium delmotii]